MFDTPKSRRQVNRQDLAFLCNVSLPTVDKWVGLGVPFVSRGSKGRVWVFDISEVIAWRMDFAVKAALAPYQASDVGVSKEEADRRRAVAMAIVAEIEADVAQKSVVLVDAVIQFVADEYSVVRNKVISQPGRLSSRLANRPAAVIAEILADDARETLGALSDPGDVAGKAG